MKNRNRIVSYNIQIFALPITARDYLIIVEKIRYYCRKYNASWLAVYSTTNSKTANPTTCRTRKRGRPPKMIQGDKVDGHTHIVIRGSENQSAYKATQCIKESIDKRYERLGFEKKASKIVTIKNENHFNNFIDYCYRQADIKRSGGEFDFDDYWKRLKE